MTETARPTKSQETRSFIEKLKIIGKESIDLIISTGKVKQVGMSQDRYQVLDNIINAILNRPGQQVFTAKEYEQVSNFFHRWATSVLSIGEDEKGKYASLFLNIDPAVFFPFLRPDSVFAGRGFLGADQARLLKKSVARLNELCPERESVIKSVMTQIFRRLMGDFNTTSPLLVGGPSTGKTEIAWRIVDALQAVGLRVAFVFQSMTEKNGVQSANQTEMKLLGSDSHFNNAKPGSIFKLGAQDNIDLCIVLLDEAEKHDNCSDLMVNLLDPCQPLKDTFIQSIWEDIDLRHKTMFLLSANDDKPLRRSDSDPLWSRLEPVFFKPYTEKQLIRLLITLGCRDYGKKVPAYRATKPRCKKIAQELVDQFGTELSFRQYLNRMGERLAAEALGIQLDQEELSMPKKQKIGF